MAKKHIPLKDRPTVVFNGTLEEKKSVRVSGKTMIEIKIKQGTTLYRILLDELAEKTLPQVGKFDKFETVEKDFITYKYKEIDIKNLDTELHLSGGTFTNTAGQNGPFGGSGVSTNGLLHNAVITGLNP